MDPSSFPPSKKMRIADSAEEADVCVVCMRNPDELLLAESPMMPTHSCPQCNPTSWKICEGCEEHCLSRKCPVCRGEYAPIVLYSFPDPQPDILSTQPLREAKLFKAKMSLMLKLVGGSNTAVYLPADNILRFYLPQDFGTSENDARFLQVDIGGAYDRVVNGQFEFSDRIWDELENAQNALDEGQTGDDPDVVERDEAADPSAPSPTYVDIAEADCPSEIIAKINQAFLDTEDHLNFTVVSVCRTEDSGDQLFFKYYDTDRFPDAPPANPTDFEYTPVEELLSAGWVTWAADKEDWVQCLSCSKWRRLPKRGSQDPPMDLPADWTCSANTWDDKNKCTIPEEPYDDLVSVSQSVDGVSVPHVTSALDTLEEPPRQIGNEGDGTIGLTEAIRRIIRDLKNSPGATLFTRLPPDTTSSILEVALDTTV